MRHPPYNQPKAGTGYQGIVISSPMTFNPCRDVTPVLPRKAEWYQGFKEATSQLFKSVLDFLTTSFPVLQYTVSEILNSLRTVEAWSLS